MNATCRPSHDRGTVLPLVLIVVVVMGLVIAALADYASSTLRYGQTVERSGDRITAAGGGLDNALEAIERHASLCTLTALANQPAGYTFDLDIEINGLAPSITCRLTSGPPITGTEEFALVLTSPGDLNPPALIGDALLNITDGGTGARRKVIDGPVFMARPPNDSWLDTLNVQADITVRDGDLWYTGDGGCLDPDPDVRLPGRLALTPVGRDARCVEQAWTTLFAGAPPEPDLGTFATPPAPEPSGGCRVWQPGRYTTPPDLDDAHHHYFASGDYYFDFTSDPRWAISDASVLFGPPGPAGPALAAHDGSPSPRPHPCQSAWLADTASPPGATIYLGGPSRIDVAANGALEIAGRDQGGRIVAIQALGPASSNPTTLLADTPRLLKSDSTSASQITVGGLIWAPANSVELSTVTNDAVAAITGGAVIGELHIGAPASATNVLARAGRDDATRTFEITSTVVSPEGGRTSARAVIEYRHGDVAVLSRRVVCLTPGDDPAIC